MVETVPRGAAICSLPMGLRLALDLSSAGSGKLLTVNPVSSAINVSAEVTAAGKPTLRFGLGAVGLVDLCASLWPSKICREGSRSRICCVYSGLEATGQP